MNRSILFRLIPLAVSAALPFAAAAQNLDPTVVVDRNYEGKLMEVHKPSPVSYTHLTLPTSDLV